MSNFVYFFALLLVVALIVKAVQMLRARSNKARPNRPARLGWIALGLLGAAAQAQTGDTFNSRSSDPQIDCFQRTQTALYDATLLLNAEFQKAESIVVPILWKGCSVGYFEITIPRET